MADLKGQGAFSSVNLIVHLPKNGEVTKDGKATGHFVDVQVDQSLLNPDKVKTGEKKADTNPHLVSNPANHPNGGTYVSHRVFMGKNQVDAMRTAAGKKVVTLTDEKHAGDTVLNIKADIMKNSKGELIINTNKPMEAGKNPYFGNNILQKQAAVTAAAREYRDSQRQQQAQANVAEKQTELENEQEFGDDNIPF